MTPSIERIIALKPQIVLVSTASQLESFTKQLDQQKIAVYVTDPHSLEEVFDRLRRSEICSARANKRRRWWPICGGAPPSSKQSSTKATSVGLLSAIGRALYTIGRESF